VEEAIGLPGWLSARLDGVFGNLGTQAHPARQQYVACLTEVLGPAPSDLLGMECERCRAGLLDALAGLDIDLPELGRQLEAVEAELAGNS